MSDQERDTPETPEEREKREAAFERTAANLRKKAEEAEKKAEQQRRKYRHDDYLYDLHQAGFWNIPLCAFFKEADSVNSSIPLEYWRVEVEDPEAAAEAAAAAGVPTPAPTASTRVRRRPGRTERMFRPSDDIKRLENNLVVETSTWAPGYPPIIKDLLPTDGGFIAKKGVRVFNTYLPPSALPANFQPRTPRKWLDLCKRVVPDKKERKHLYDFMAHLVQRPAEKPNFCIVMIGEQGIGKDSIWLPVTHAIGLGNVHTIGPDDVLSSSGFNPWAESKLLVINEVRPAQEEHRQSDLYEKLKPYTASPPMMLALNQKHQKVRYVVNVMGVVILTNHRMAIFIPPGDRRMVVLESLLARNWHIAEGMPNYFRDYYRWLEEGIEDDDDRGRVPGYDDVRWWLEHRNIAHFNPKAAAMDTAVKTQIAGLWGAPNPILDDALERVGRPDIAFGFQLLDETPPDMPGDGDSKELLKLLRAGRRREYAADASDYSIVKTRERLRITQADNKQREATFAFVKKSVRFSMSDSDLQAAIRAAMIAVVAGHTRREASNE